MACARFTLAKLKSSCDLSLLWNKASTWIGNGLALFHRLLRDGQNGVGLQGVVERLVHREQDLFLRGQCVLVLRFGRQVGARNQICRASEVGD